MKIVSLFLIFILSPISNSFGEDLFLTAEVNKNKINLGEEIELKVEITGDFRITPKVDIPDLKDFEVVSKKSAYNFGIKRGRFISQIRFNFILRPKSEGKFVIGEFKVRYRRKEYRTKPIEITVLPGFNQIPKRPKKRYPETPKITL
jgi:FKBP-type peptidyl-prolyl cis-trans isomerase (trigger factor)